MGWFIIYYELQWPSLQNTSLNYKQLALLKKIFSSQLRTYSLNEKTKQTKWICIYSTYNKHSWVKPM